MFSLQLVQDLHIADLFRPFLCSCLIMEHNEILSSTKQDSPEVIPSLIKFIASNEVAGFDSMEDICSLNNQYQMNGFQPVSLSSEVSNGLFIFGKHIKIYIK